MLLIVASIKPSDNNFFDLETDFFEDSLHVAGDKQEDPSLFVLDTTSFPSIPFAANSIRSYQLINPSDQITSAAPVIHQIKRTAQTISPRPNGIASPPKKQRTTSSTKPNREEQGAKLQILLQELTHQQDLRNLSQHNVEALKKDLTSFFESYDGKSPSLCKLFDQMINFPKKFALIMASTNEIILFSKLADRYFQDLLIYNQPFYASAVLFRNHLHLLTTFSDHRLRRPFLTFMKNPDKFFKAKEALPLCVLRAIRFLEDHQLSFNNNTLISSQVPSYHVSDEEFLQVIDFIVSYRP